MYEYIHRTHSIFRTLWQAIDINFKNTLHLYNKSAYFIKVCCNLLMWCTFYCTALYNVCTFAPAHVALSVPEAPYLGEYNRFNGLSILFFEPKEADTAILNKSSLLYFVKARSLSRWGLYQDWPLYDFVCVQYGLNVVIQSIMYVHHPIFSAEYRYTKADASAVNYWSPVLNHRDDQPPFIWDAYFNIP